MYEINLFPLYTTSVIIKIIFTELIIYTNQDNIYNNMIQNHFISHTIQHDII